MINRTLYTKLLEWKNGDEKLPVLLRGARQVGKTTIVKQLSLAFDNYIELNLERPEENALFEL